MAKLSDWRQSNSGEYETYFAVGISDDSSDPYTYTIFRHGGGLWDLIATIQRTTQQVTSWAIPVCLGKFANLEDAKKRALDHFRSRKIPEALGARERDSHVYGSLPDRKELERARDISKLLHADIHEQLRDGQLKRDVTRIADTFNYFAAGDNEVCGSQHITQFYSFDLTVAEKTGIDAVSCQVSISPNAAYPTVRVGKGACDTHDTSF